LIPVILFFMVNSASAQNLASDFSLKDLNGEEVRLSQFRDKEAVLLFFWTTRCPFCRKEIINLNKMKEQLLKDNVRIITININEPKERISRFLEKYSLDIPVLRDDDAYVAGLYSVVGVPTFVLIDKQGIITFEGHYFPDDYKKRI